jgi:polyketide synthase 5
VVAALQHSPFAEPFRSTGQNPTGTSKLRAELDELPLDEWPTRPLYECGVDSLGALELRTHIETETGIRITSTDITTIRGLAGLLCEKLVPVEAA